jgi:hypothetical protein
VAEHLVGQVWISGDALRKKYKEIQMGMPTEDASNHPNTLSAYIAQTISANESFLLDNAKGVLEEVVGLITDAIDIAGFALKRPNIREEYAKYSMVFFMFNALLPYSYGIYLELIAANLPVCLIELRLLLETLTKCYLADLKYPHLPFFQEKLESLQQAQRNISNLMDEMGNELGIGDEFHLMWKSLSEDWVHTKGLVGKVVSQVMEKASVPPWALAVPLNYALSDLESVDELRRQIAVFRILLKTSIEKYRHELDSSNR